MNPFEISRDGTTVTVTLQGKLTAVEVPALQPELTRELAGGARELVIDFAKAGALDSTGIGLLIACHNSLNAVSGVVRVINVAPEIMKLLQSMRLAGRLHATAAGGEPARG